MKYVRIRIQISSYSKEFLEAVSEPIATTKVHLTFSHFLIQSNKLTRTRKSNLKFRKSGTMMQLVIAFIIETKKNVTWKFFQEMLSNSISILVYAVFHTPSAFHISVVCAYRMSQINLNFDHGRFKVIF